MKILLYIVVMFVGLLAIELVGMLLSIDRDTTDLLTKSVGAVCFAVFAIKFSQRLVKR